MRATNTIALFEKHARPVLPLGFSIKGGYLFYTSDEGDPLQVCSAIDVIASTRSEDDTNYGKLLSWLSTENITIQWAMPLSLLEGEPKQYLQVFADRGLETPNDHHTRRLLKQYLKQCKPLKKLISISTLGWYKNVYITPHKAYGESAKSYVYQNSYHHTLNKTDDNEQVTLSAHQTWLDTVFHCCKGNHKLIFAISASIAPVLLKHRGQGNIGLHFYGQSSQGKTTLLKVANSIWGDTNRLRKWNATQNGLEAIASEYNDGLLCLDEIGEANKKQLPNTIYMLGNGQGKMRANREGLSRETKQFRLVYLSNGELPLEQALNEGGHRVFSGQEVRLIDIPADDSSYGAFDDVKDLTAKQFAEQLNQYTENTHSIIGIFLEKLTHNLNDNLSIFNDYYKQAKSKLRDFLDNQEMKQMDNAAYRAIDHFAFIAASGELANHLGFIHLDEDDVLSSTINVVKSWLKNKNKLPNEQLGILKQLEAGIQSHIDQIGSNQNDINISKQVGFTRHLTDYRKEYYLLKSTYKNFFSGYSLKQVNHFLLQHGIIKQFQDGRFDYPFAIRNNQHRCVAIAYYKLLELLKDVD